MSIRKHNDRMLARLTALAEAMIREPEQRPALYLLEADHRAADWYAEQTQERLRLLDLALERLEGRDDV